MPSSAKSVSRHCRKSARKMSPNNARVTPRAPRAQGLAQRRDIGRVAAVRADIHLVERQFERPCLRFDQLLAHAVHRDALVFFADGGDERRDFEFAAAAQAVERQRRILAAAPECDRLFHAASLKRGWVRS
ncbi:MAG TPA: hypothetical protein VN899_09315 [Stellaceae bacterium]|nr:hypothetical protein [Stellaceae bacterium]